MFANQDPCPLHLKKVVGGAGKSWRQEMRLRWWIVPMLGCIAVAALAQSTGPVAPSLTAGAGATASEKLGVERRPEPTSQSPAANLFERLKAHLRAIPARWGRIAEPVVPDSGRALEAVLSSSSEEENRLALERIRRLIKSAPSDRKAVIEKELASRAGSEVDLWMPALLEQKLQLTSMERSALLVDAWLDWAEALGRKDVLLYAAGCGVELISLHEGSRSAMEAASLWLSLPRIVHGERARADLLRIFAHCLFLTGETEKSLSSYRGARELFAEVGDKLGQGNTYVGEAEVLFRSGETEESLSSYRSARKFFEAVGSRLDQGNTYYGEAEVLLQLGENEKSLSSYRSARKLYEEVGDRLGQGNTYRGEAYVLFHMGDNETSLSSYRTARKLFEEEGDREGQGNTYKGEAEVLFRLGENERSLSSYRNARKLFEEMGDRQGLGNTYKGEADVLSVLGENEKSLVLYRRARKLFEEMGARLGQGNTYLGEAKVLFRLGETEKSLSSYQSARELFKKIGESLGEGSTYLGEATVLVRLGEGREAAHLAAEAIEIFHKVGATADESVAWLVKAAGEALVGGLESAMTSAEAAIRVHERFRATLVAEARRVEYDEIISVCYDAVVPIRLRQGRVAEALVRAEESRSRVLLDLLAPRLEHKKTGSAIDLRDERQRLDRELARVGVQIEQAADPDRQEELRAARRRLDHDLEWNSYQRIAAEKDFPPNVRPLDASAIQALAGETGPILLYYVAETELIGFLVLPGVAEVFTARIAVSRASLGERVRDFVHGEANPLYASDERMRARELWDLLIGPFAQRLPAGGPLVLVPHGPLHELPFEALLDPRGAPLFTRWEVSVSPSVSSLALARGRHSEAEKQDSFLAFFSGRGLDLPDEVARQIASLFDRNQATFRPTEARFENYERLAIKARHILIATNGSFVQGSRRETFLAIEPTPDVHDRRLSAAEIAALPLAAELVTLAACDTARGEALLSDDRLDLSRSFLIAGAASVLATRWKVPESSSTSDFLLDFYRAYRQGGSKGKGLRKDQALNMARERSRERGDPAQVWAAWVLIGDPR